MTWTFQEYVLPGGRGAIADWFEDLEPEAQAKFDGRLNYLGVLPRDKWVRPEFGVLGGGLCEIRFFAGVQHRVFGYFGSVPETFLMMIGAKKKQRRFDPPEAEATAKKRYKAVTGRKATTRYYEF